MSELMKKAQQHIEAMTKELSGDGDFTPFMTLLNPQGEITYVGIMMPEGGEVRDTLAATMTAVCVIQNAVEATFSSASWMVSLEGERKLSVPPSEHPDRVETAFIITIAEGVSTMTTANIIRENNKVEIGLWTEVEQGHALGGRFSDALRYGIELAKRLPPDLRELFDQEVKEGRGQGLVDILSDTVQKARTVAETSAQALRN